MGFMDGLGGGLGGAIGSFITNDMNRSNADHAMDRNDAAAREQMAFQERMSSSAYQRATTDMKAAGINPMAAFQQGGASTPSGAAGSMSPAKAENALGAGISSALDAMRLKNETKAQGSQQALNDAMATKALADTETAGASAKSIRVQTEATASQLAAIRARAKADEATAAYDYKASTYDAIANRVNRDSNSAKNVMDVFKPRFNPLKKGEGKINFKTGEILQEGR